MAVVASVDTKNTKKKKKRKHKNIRDMVGKEKLEFTEDCIKTETSIIRDNFFEAHHEQKLHFKNSKQHQACQHESTETKLSHRKTNKKKPQKRKREPDICSKMLSDTIPSKKQRKCVEEQMKETDLKSEMPDLQGKGTKVISCYIKLYCYTVLVFTKQKKLILCLYVYTYYRL